MASIVTNSLAMLAARLSVPLFSFGINVAVARVLGEHVLGAWVELVAMVLIAQSIAGGGFPSLVARDVAAHPGDADEVAREGHRTGFATGLLATVLFLLYARLALPPDVRPAAFVLAISILPSSWISVQEGWLIGRELHPRIATISLVEGVAKVLAAIAVFALGGGLFGLCAGLTLARIAAFVAGRFVLSRAGARHTWRTPDRPLGPFLRALAPFGAMYALGIVYFRQDVLVIGALRTERETGFYAVASVFYAMALLVPSSLMSALYPRLALAFSVSTERWKEASSRAMRLLTVSSMPLALGLIAVADPLVRIVYGERFAEATPTLRLLAALLPLHAANAAIGQALQAAHLQNVLLSMTVLAVVSNLLANLWFVADRGIEGAAIALGISSALSLVVQSAIHQRRIAPLGLGLRHLPALLLVVAPIGIVLACDASWRPSVAAAGLALVGLLARPTGLLAAGDLWLASREGTHGGSEP